MNHQVNDKNVFYMFKINDSKVSHIHQDSVTSVWMIDKLKHSNGSLKTNLNSNCAEWSEMSKEEQLYNGSQGAYL